MSGIKGGRGGGGCGGGGYCGDQKNQNPDPCQAAAIDPYKPVLDCLPDLCAPVEICGDQGKESSGGFGFGGGAGGQKK